MSRNIELSNVMAKRPDSNVFDFTHDVKMSGNMGELMPIMTFETIPGDRIKLSADVFVRFAPMLYPIMHRVDVHCHYFNIPARLVWENWGKFYTDKPTGGLPFITIDGTETPEQKRLLDYMGIPPHPGAPAPPVDINAMPLAAFQLTYNEYYRNQQLEPDWYDLGYIKLVDGDNNAKKSYLLTMRYRSWEKDQFTACLPEPQLGAAVKMPGAEIILDPDWADGTFAGNNPFFINNNGGGISPGNVHNTGGPGGIDIPPDPDPQAYDPQGTLITNAPLISALRLAEALQVVREKMNQFGTRLTEYVYGMFGVKSSDKTLQRPQYITGTSTPVVISEVLNTTGAPDSNPQGAYAGHGVSVGQGYYKKGYYCEEVGYVIGIMSVRPLTAYQQGIPQLWSRFDNYDFFNPNLAHVGDEAVRLQELMAYVTPNTTFGYRPRYTDYKMMPSRVAGEMRREPLLSFHLGRVFDPLSPPQLNEEFIKCKPEDTSRIFAITDPDIADNLYIHVINKMHAQRFVPRFSTPRLNA